MLQSFWLIRPEVHLYWELSGASKIHVMWPNAGGLSGVALIGAEPGRVFVFCQKRVGATAEVVFALLPFDSCLFGSLLEQSEAHPLNSAGSSL